MKQSIFVITIIATIATATPAMAQNMTDMGNMTGGNMTAGNMTETESIPTAGETGCSGSMCPRSPTTEPIE